MAHLEDKTFSNFTKICSIYWWKKPYNYYENTSIQTDGIAMVLPFNPNLLKFQHGSHRKKTRQNTKPESFEIIILHHQY